MLLTSSGVLKDSGITNQKAPESFLVYIYVSLYSIDWFNVLMFIKAVVKWDLKTRVWEEGRQERKNRKKGRKRRRERFPTPSYYFVLSPPYTSLDWPYIRGWSSLPNDIQNAYWKWILEIKLKETTYRKSR